MQKFIYGTHEPAPDDVLKGKGWIVFLAEIGHETEIHPGIDFTEWEERGYGILCRIQHRFGVGGGCLPLPEHLDAFVQRVETLVQNSAGCHKFIIGNEMNLQIEWPSGVNLLPEYVGLVYDYCRQTIHSLPGHEHDQVILPPVGPWNVESDMGWIEYFERMIGACAEIDAFALHTYSRGHDPQSIVSEQKMDAPYTHLYNGFRTYRDWMAAIPERYCDRPVYITETNQMAPWRDENEGWVQAAYREIDDWNKVLGNQKIRCLCLYRWPRHDEYYLDGKRNVVADLHEAMAHEYKWEDEPMGTWVTFYQTSFDQGFHAHDGISELTVPNGFVPDWQDDPEEGVLDRPEYKPKETPQPEVRTPRFAASLGTTFASHRAVLAKTLTGIKAGTHLRITCWAMGVSHHNDGSVGGGLGQVVGIGDAGDSFMSVNGIWGEWWSSDIEDWEEREWQEIKLEIEAPTDDPVLYLRSDAREKWQAQYSHFDDLRVEVWVENGEPGPSPGNGIKAHLLAHVNEIQLSLNDLRREIENLDSYAVLCLPLEAL